MQAIRSNTKMHSYLGSIIEECQKLLSKLPLVSLFFVKQSTNRVAHALTMASYFTSDFRFSGRVVLAEIEATLIADMS